MDILILDNVDSFTYNLVHVCHAMVMDMTGEPGDIHVFRSDVTTVSDIEKMNPSCIVISPGPGTPDDAGITCDVIQHFAGKKPILGVCLGMQAIAQCHGATIIKGVPVHGKKEPILHSADHPMFEGVPSPVEVVRYHSLQVAPESVDETRLDTIAWTEGHVIMAVSSLVYPLMWGVQFHPESIGSQYGQRLLGNFYEAVILDKAVAVS